ncbi:MAG TPA: hypothetical protein O0X27_04150 [Methanocorpusculum sp.]|nr:hypothetical protein [Methanocorpusculum sp.]
MTVRSNPGWSARLSASLARDLPRTMSAGMEQVEQEAKRIVYLGHPHHLNRGTGRLRASITTACRTGDGTISASVGTSLSYAPTHEFGAVISRPDGSVSVIPARPFLLPAFSAKKDTLSRTVARRVKDMVKEECR